MEFVHWLLLGTLLSPVLCRAQDGCPWINTATVIDAPNPAVSDLQGVVTNEGDKCQFHFWKQGLLYSVQIAIYPSTGGGKDTAKAGARCEAAKTPLTGIGNEASLCNTGTGGERVIGRVRNRMFVVDLSVKSVAGSSHNAELANDMATMIAKQVAGNLF